MIGALIGAGIPIFIAAVVLSVWRLVDQLEGHKEPPKPLLTPVTPAHKLANDVSASLYEVTKAGEEAALRWTCSDGHKNPVAYQWCQWPHCFHIRRETIKNPPTPSFKLPGWEDPK